MRAVALAAALLASSCATEPRLEPPSIAPKLQAIEAASGGRLGVALVDGKGRMLAGHRSDERFAFCSTFKLLLAAMVLDGHSKGRWSLDERLALTKEDLVFHSPVSETRTGQGWISIGDAARAIVTISDNAAANLLIRKVGGAAAFNAWLRALGDPATRLDRSEPELNANQPGDPRDTTTPEAIARSASRLLFGGALEASQQRILRGWLVESETGLKRIRAGLPGTFVAGDKTGTCGAQGRESYNDVAFILPRPGEPGHGHVLAVYLDRPAGEGDQANARIAEVARATAGLMN